MNRIELRTDFNDEVRIVRAQRATTAILTRHLLILHCQEDHCTRMRKYVVTYTHELLTFSLFFSCDLSFFLTFSFFLSLFLVYLITTNDGVSFMPLQSLIGTYMWSHSIVAFSCEEISNTVRDKERKIFNNIEMKRI